MSALAGARTHAQRAAWAVADQGVNPLVQLLITPILLRGLGKEEFALWALANAAIAASQLVSVGAPTSATKHVSADLASGARSEAIAATRAAFSITLLGSGIAASLIFAFSGWIAKVFFGHLGRPEHVAPIVVICGIAAAIQEIDNTFAGVLRGAERFDLGAKVEIPARVLMGFVLVALTRPLTTAHPLIVALIIMMVAKASAKAVQVAKLLRTPLCCIPSARPSALGKVCRFGVWQWIQSGGSILFTAGDQLIVGSILGGQSLTRYSVCLQIAQYAQLLPSVMMQVIFPRISAMGASLESQRGNDILRRSTLAATGIALAVGLPMIVGAYPILRFWIGQDFAAENYPLLMLLVLVHIALAASVGAYYVLLGSGRVKRSAAITLAAGALQAFFAVIVAPAGLLTVAANRSIYSVVTFLSYRAARYGRSTDADSENSRRLSPS